MPKKIPTNSLITITKEEKSCMFCLCETPTIVQYDGPCPCKPYLHIHCLEQWFINTPNECPLCRKDYDPLSETEEEVEAVEAVPRNCVIRICNYRIQFNIEQCKKNTRYLIIFIYLGIFVYCYMNLITRTVLYRS